MSWPRAARSAVLRAAAGPWLPWRKYRMRASSARPNRSTSFRSGERSSQSHHLLAVPDLVRGLLEEVAEHILAAEITAAPDHAAREVDGEVHPRLMAESIECALGSLGGLAQIHQALAERIVKVHRHH